MTHALLVSPTGVLGGAERALINLARELPTLGVQVQAVLLSDGPLSEKLEMAGCRTTVVRAGRTRQLLKTAQTLNRIAAMARDADLVISNQSKGHFYGGLAARRANVPEIWWQHSIPGHGRIDQVAARIPTATIACTTEMARAAQARLTPHTRIVTIPPGTDVEAVAAHVGSGEQVRRQLGWTDHKIVGIVGRLEPWKGQRDFLRAAAALAKIDESLRFLVVGGAILGWEGDYPEQLELLARQLGVEDRVHFVGQQDAIYPWFDALDVVVNASRAEPFGLVVVEALALSKPVVAYADGGPLEIIEDGGSGLLVPPGDWRELATAVRRVLTDRELADRLRRGARKRADFFTSQQSAQMFARVANAVVADRSEQSLATAAERTVPGLHSYVVETVLDPVSRPGMRCVDLGAGSGALARRLKPLGIDVISADVDPAAFTTQGEFREVDLNDSGFPVALGRGTFDLVTAVEVIEHLEAPVAFLRGVASLLAPDGIAVVTTPNVDSLPARAKFLLKGKLRMLDEHGDPTHISPIFWDLLIRQYLPLAGLELRAHSVFPPDGFVTGRPTYRRLMTLASPALNGRQNLLGDNHVLVLARSQRR